MRPHACSFGNQYYFADSLLNGLFGETKFSRSSVENANKRRMRVPRREGASRVGRNRKTGLHPLREEGADRFCGLRCRLEAMGVSGEMWGVIHSFHEKRMRHASNVQIFNSARRQTFDGSIDMWWHASG